MITSKPTLAIRSLIVGAAIVGLAACQPTPATTQLPTGPSSEATTTLPVNPENTTTTAPVTTTTQATTTTTTAVAGTRPGWTLVGGDEFDGASLNTSKWKPYFNTYGDSNNELACLTPNNVSQSGGTVKITAKKQTVTCSAGTTEQYTSGFLGSRETGTYYPKYARFEMRAKLPHAQGLWPAFWLRHRNGAGTAEVDIMEYFHSQVPGKTTQTLHLDGRTNLSKKTTAFEAPTLSPGWHTWAVEILPDPNGVRFTFSLDDTAVHTYVDTQHNWASSDPNATWDIALNLAVGGNWVGRPGDTTGYLRDLNRCSISGTAPGGCTTTGIRNVDWAHSTYEIDYVRVYTKS
ncbi:MAG TPA: glycoside hydrolase family 16 protein [Aquihabitans sp.]|nr:glycoside hydrolase family 16 protein [Aquihabitans sp.]